MRKTILPIAVALASLLLPAAADAQVRASIELNLPVVLPQLVVVAPGVQVIPEVDHEVFLVNGVYWARHGDGWYKSRNHRRGWVFVPGRAVPARLVKLQPGKYRRWKAAKHHDRGVRDHGRGEGRGGHGHGDDRGGHGRGDPDDHDRGGGKHGRRH